MFEHLHHEYVDALREFYIVDAQTAASRWQQSASVAQQRYTEGVQNTQKDPTQLAVQAQSKMVQAWNASVTSGRYARGLQKVGKAGWQQRTVDKAANFANGIQQSGDKYLQAIGPVLQAEASLQQQIMSMPNNSIEDAIARSAAWQRGLHAWAQGR